MPDHDDDPMPDEVTTLDVAPDGGPADGIVIEGRPHIPGSAPLGASPAGPRTCRCVTNHTPRLGPADAEGHHIWPRGWGGPDRRDNMIWICSNTHTQVHQLLEQWRAHGGEPPWSVRKTFRPFVRDLAEQGWTRAHPPTL